MQQTAVFGGGCFWGVERVFSAITGVVKTEVGYAGGHLPDPSYEQVCSGNTGHAEVVKIEYDDQQVSYASLVDVFLNIHDPTQVDRQGPDIGTQYRSIIMYLTPEQKTIAEQALDAARSRFSGPVATEVVPFDKFYAAEEYHQRYFEKNPHKFCSM